MFRFNLELKRKFHLTPIYTSGSSYVKIFIQDQYKPIISSPLSITRQQYKTSITSAYVFPHVIHNLFQKNEIQSINYTHECIQLDVDVSHSADIDSYLDVITSSYYSQILDTHIQVNDKVESIEHKLYSPYEQEIEHTIQAYVRQALIEDGGNIKIDHYNEDTQLLYVILEGSCKTCSSSQTTLQEHVERLLCFYHPEIKGIKTI